MDLFLASIIAATIIVVVFTMILLKWLKSNYPEAYENDPIMVGLGGAAAFIVMISKQLHVMEPYDVLIAAIPIYAIVSYMSASSFLKRALYVGASITTLLLITVVVFWNNLNAWLLYFGAFIIFMVLWVLLFRWRYVLRKSN